MRGWRAALLAAALLAAGGGLAATHRAAAGAEERRSAAPAARKPPDYDAPVERWREGPVRYLLGKDEDDTFRALTTDEARAGFIQTFWARRDPIASTPENEYRSLFYARVADANRVFMDSTKPGWKTDRGKIYILLGPPDDFEQPQSRNVFAPDAITWTYRNRRLVGIDALPIIRFVKDATGEYRLADNLVLSSIENPISIAFQTQAMQMKSLPEPTKVLDTIVSTRTLFDASPFRTHSDFLRATDGGTFAVLTLGVKPDLLLQAAQEKAAGGPAGAAPGSVPGPQPAAAGARFEVVARLVGGRPDLPTYDFAGSSELRAGPEDSASDASGYLLFQGGQVVRPGPYAAYYGVVDRPTGEVFSFKEQVEVPDLHEERFRLSALTLASRLERVERAAGGYSTPFVLGGLKAIPRPDDMFHNGEDFACYYQIYGSETDPIDGRPDLDLEYQFYAARDSGPGGLVFAPLGKPIRLTRQRSQVQGYAIPIKDWQRGTYRLRVQVTDNVGDRQTTGEVSFRVL